MITVDVNVIGSDIIAKAPLIASGTAGKIRVRFNFDGEWQGLAKTAVFHSSRGDILVPLVGDACEIPAAAMAKCGDIRFGVFGTDGEMTLTTVFCVVKVGMGVPTSGEDAVNYVPSIYEQFAAKFAKFENMSADASEGEIADATLTDSGEKMRLSITIPRGENGKNGADGYTPVRGTDYWTDADIAQIKSYVNDAILGGEW